MKQTRLLKTLLAAVCLLVGTSSVWAGKIGTVTTNTKINFNGNITAANPCTYTKATDEICGTTTGWFWRTSNNTSASSDNGIDGNGHFLASNGNISIMMDNPSVGAKDIVSISFDIAFGGHTSKNAAQTIKLLTSGANLVEESYTNTAVGNSTMGLTEEDLTAMGFGGDWRNTSWSERVHYNFTVNYATQKIALVVKNTSRNTIIEKEIDMPANAGYVIGVNIGSSNQGAKDRGVMFDNVYITTTEGDYGDIISEENSYTVNNTDIYQLFTEIQCPDITLELFGNAARSTTDYYFQYTNGSGWASYEYTSGDIAYECAITKYNDTAPTAADIYGADDPTNGQIAKVTVTVSDKWQTETNSSKLCLTGPMGTIISGYQATAGVIYKFTPTKDGYLNFNFYKYSGIQYRTWVSGSSYYASHKSANNELKTWSLWVTKGTTYYLRSDHETAYQMKMYSFEFVPSIPATTTSAGKGWATLYTPYALDFTNATPATLKAYTATLEGTTVTLTEVQNVPAGTGVVLKSSTTGENVNYSIPVIASSETPQGDMTGSATSGTHLDEGDAYLLGINGTTGKAQFFINSEGTIDAGKAYLPAGNAGAKALSVVFANDMTGITNANAAEEIAQPAKRIVNGQLVIEKNGKRYNAAGAEF